MRCEVRREAKKETTKQPPLFLRVLRFGSFLVLVEKLH